MLHTILIALCTLYFSENQAKMKLILFTFCIMAWSVCYGAQHSTELSNHVIFSTMSDVTLTNSRWSLSFVIDLKPFYTFLSKLNRTVTETKDKVHDMAAEFKGQDIFHTSFEGVLREFDFIELRFIDLLQRFNILQFLVPYGGQETVDVMPDLEIDFNRTKRFTLLPGLGKLHAWLYGTATKEMIRDLQHEVKELFRGQEKLFHVVEEALSIMEITRTDVKYNRQTINSLIDTVTELELRLRDYRSELSMKIFSLKQYVAAYIHADLILAEIRDMLNEGIRYLQNLELQLAQLSTQHLSPSLISPDQLRTILHNLADELPRNLRLPYNPDTELLEYYKIMNAVAIGMNFEIVVLTTIPLNDMVTYYKVYHAMNLPIPAPLEDSDLTAKYELESNYFAISRDRTTYVLLTDHEFLQCTMRRHCSVGSPVYPVIRARLCVIILFFGDQQMIEEHCEVLITNIPLPMAHNIGQGGWVVITRDPVDFTILCTDGRTEHVRITYPIGLVELGMSCTGSSQHMTLTSYYYRRTDYNWVDGYRMLLNRSSISDILRVWSPLVQAFDNRTRITIPPHLEDMVDVPIEQLIKEIRDFEYVPPPPSPWRYILTGAVALMIVGSLGILIVKYGLCARIRLFMASNRALGYLSSRLTRRQHGSPGVPTLQRESVAHRLSVLQHGGTTGIYPEVPAHDPEDSRSIPPPYISESMGGVNSGPCRDDVTPRLEAQTSMSVNTGASVAVRPSSGPSTEAERQPLSPNRSESNTENSRGERLTFSHLAQDTT